MVFANCSDFNYLISITSPLVILYLLANLEETISGSVSSAKLSICFPLSFISLNRTTLVSLSRFTLSLRILLRPAPFRHESAAVIRLIAQPWHVDAICSARFRVNKCRGLSSWESICRNNIGSAVQQEESCDIYRSCR